MTDTYVYNLKTLLNKTVVGLEVLTPVVKKSFILWGLHGIVSQKIELLITAVLH
jgi:hypothetical protein